MVIYLILLITFLLLMKDTYSYMIYTQIFNLKHDGTFTLIDEIDWSPNNNKSSKNVCGSNQVYNQQFEACITTCGSNEIIDTEINTCKCDKGYVRNGKTCEPTCLPTLSTFKLKNLKTNINNKCVPVFETNNYCPITAPYKYNGQCSVAKLEEVKGLQINENEYQIIGDGSKDTCLNKKECDALINNKMVRFKNRNDVSYGWSPNEKSVVHFKVTS